MRRASRQRVRDESFESGSNRAWVPLVTPKFSRGYAFRLEQVAIQDLAPVPSSDINRCSNATSPMTGAATSACGSSVILKLASFAFSRSREVPMHNIIRDRSILNQANIHIKVVSQYKSEMVYRTDRDSGLLFRAV